MQAVGKLDVVSATDGKTDVYVTRKATKGRNDLAA